MQASLKNEGLHIFSLALINLILTTDFKVVIHFRLSIPQVKTIIEHDAAFLCLCLQYAQAMQQ